MAKKGERKMMKVYTASKAMRVIRKKPRLVTKARAGPHALDKSIPLNIVLRDLMQIARTAREARIILNEGRVSVDGVIVKDPRRPIGFMDVISLHSISKHYRMLYDKKGRLTVTETNDANFKLCRVQNKKTTKKGLQLNLHDGRNILIKKDKYKTGGTVKLSLPQQKIIDYYPLETGNIVYVTGGKHAGEIATVQTVVEGTQTRKTLLELKSKKAEFQTTKDYAFILGTKKPEIKIKEEDSS